MEIIDKLHRFYEDCNYSPSGFRCENENCSAHPVHVKGKIWHGVEAYVGEDYQETLRRVVFLSSDIGDNEERTMEGRRKVIEEIIEGKKTIKSHMRGTIETLGIILQKLDKVGDMKVFCKCKNNRELVKKCAIVNTVKCSRKGRMDEFQKVSSHCIKKHREILTKELSLLQPDLVIVQGNTAWRFFQKLCEKKYSSNPWPTSGYAKLGNKDIEFVAGYHPSARRGEPAWSRQRQSIFKELKKNDDA